MGWSPRPAFESATSLSDEWPADSHDPLEGGFPLGPGSIPTYYNAEVGNNCWLLFVPINQTGSPRFNFHTTYVHAGRLTRHGAPGTSAEAFKPNWTVEVRSAGFRPGVVRRPCRGSERYDGVFPPWIAPSLRSQGARLFPCQSPRIRYY